MRIAIDAQGGDHGPREIVLGALEAVRLDPDLRLVLIGNESAIRQHLPTPVPPHLEIRPASQHIEMDETPSSVLRTKKDSAVAIATRMVKEKTADACLSAGNTGAASAFALFTLGRIPGIDRPGIASVFPSAKTPVVVLDVGANVDCKPQHLADFAILGAAYAPAIRGIIPGEAERLHATAPTVGLLSIGEEPSKGNEQTRAAFALLQSAAAPAGYTFFGNVEGRDIARGTVDVVVCDGFVGNIVLKLAEGYGGMFLSTLKAALTASNRSRLGALLLSPALRAMKARLDHTNYGGAMLLGVQGPCIICHGSARSDSIASAIRIAGLAVREDVVGTIAASLRARDAKNAASSPVAEGLTDVPLPCSLEPAPNGAPESIPIPNP